MKRGVLFVLLMLLVGGVSANEVEIMDVHFMKKQKAWNVRVTLKHEDTGWDHYADAWRVVDAGGKELGKRVLYHPHENEQPFTRSLNDVNIPRNTKIVYIEARDNVHGWSPQRVEVYLERSNGPRYRVSR